MIKRQIPTEASNDLSVDVTNVERNLILQKFSPLLTFGFSLHTNVTFIERFVHFLHLGLCLKNLCPYFQ